MGLNLRASLDTNGAFLVSEAQIWTWNQIETHLEISYYTINELPELSQVTSVRGIMLRQHEVLAVKNSDGIQHIIPGGRIEQGENLLDTLNREILEETGWTITQPLLFGAIHYRHLTPCPEGYPYVYPEFLQIVYIVQAATYNAERKQTNDYEQDSRFIPVVEAIKLPIAKGQKAYLRELQPKI